MDIMSSNLPSFASSTESLTDKLTIETPEQTSLDFAIAGIGSRFLAFAIDTLIQFAVFFVLIFGGSVLTGVLAAAAPRAALWGFAGLVLLFFLIYFGYFAVFEIVWNGQTPGKRKIGLRVIKDSGRPLSPAESIGRNLMRIVDGLPAFYAIGALSAVVSKQSKRLGDYVAGSLVVRETSLNELKPLWQTLPAPTQTAAAPTLGSANLTNEDFVLIESYLNRRYDLEPFVRFRMADEILQRITAKLTLPPDSTLSTEQVLEALSHERRANSRFA
jgi:uncharacterized RDD family membrane protein YckC